MIDNRPEQWHYRNPYRLVIQLPTVPRIYLYISHQVEDLPSSPVEGLKLFSSNSSMCLYNHTLNFYFIAYFNQARVWSHTIPIITSAHARDCGIYRPYCFGAVVLTFADLLSTALYSETWIFVTLKATGSTLLFLRCKVCDTSCENGPMSLISVSWWNWRKTMY